MKEDLRDTLQEALEYAIDEDVLDLVDLESVANVLVDAITDKYGDRLENLVDFAQEDDEP